ncbi:MULTISPECIES: MaoC/PaaZ C-terminal domain-containing protein [unclassified Rhodococcus (in: high G+C Gram-positive bacteria)]|uniref:MaoC family dehydratase n=1 Tax=unclassified Rhodococcus (in: high G+C Gram-positive bacteria) TaxID=192944 RepID=UPI000B9C63B3|nr:MULTISPECIES: MaoC/PaaZ C-terminal domain-containing protein [unclassified Rhodococcus (in: high G+C Gram-positive bacteria)]OZE37623.1 hypothetical protein CH259_12325 [Rhodococcus sp. 05-2254-4]OZE40755.1 hypothetical protein CH261_27290 [Rhodococcus sp. 05-2254-3]OZE45746.1 hypothetical protein CH283_25945 [Rhodococcus sp. 05-2254-2]
MTTSTSGRPPGTGSMHLEDFHLGMSFRSDAWTAGVDDLRAFGEVSGDMHPMHHDPEYAASTEYGTLVAQGPYGLARYFGTLHDSGMFADTIIGLLDTKWRYSLAVVPDVKMHYCTTVTSVRRTSAGDRGVINRHIELLDENNRVLQWGTSAALVRARGTEPASSELVSHPIGIDWGRELAEGLASDDRFAASTALFDGSIGLANENTELQLRIYRGRILEVTRRTPTGPTFTLHGSEYAWSNLLTGARNDFVVRTHRGEFSTSGNGFAYLQMTKTVQLIVEAAREMTSKGLRP